MSVHFRPVTMENLKDVYLLEVGPGQDGLVAPVGYSIAEAHISDEDLHYRAIYDDDTAVGFLLCAEIRSSSQHPQCLWTSYEPRADGPREFYAKYGFEPTGDVDDGEEVALLRHWKDGTPTDDPFA